MELETHDANEIEDHGQEATVDLIESNPVNLKDELHDSHLSVPADGDPKSSENMNDTSENHVQTVIDTEDYNLDEPTIPLQLKLDSATSIPSNNDQELDKPNIEPSSDELPPKELGLDAATSHLVEVTAKSIIDAKPEAFEMPVIKTSSLDETLTASHDEQLVTPLPVSSCIKPETENSIELKINENSVSTPHNGLSNVSHSFLLNENHLSEGSESGTEEEQSVFMKELENFFRERSLEFKPPKFYGECLNCLKLWRAVTRLGGYDKVTSCKLWRQVGESFKPPKTCTTVSWTFRGFYEKALLDYERHKTNGGELSVPIASNSEPMSIENQGSGSGRARRDAAARAMQGWHSRLLGNGEVSDPIIKDKNSLSLQKRDKQLKSISILKRKKSSYMEEHAIKSARTKSSKPQLDVAVVDIGAPADWVKINVQKTKDCYEVYALVPGLLREEVRVQSDPAGRLVISGEPEHPDNPWGVTPFKKVVSLPSRIDPHQTSAVVTLHGQLFVRVPFEPLE